MWTPRKIPSSSQSAKMGHPGLVAMRAASHDSFSNLKISLNTFPSDTVCIAEGQLVNQPNQPSETRDEAFSRIVHQHARLMYRVAHSLLRHPQDAEDAVQDALLKLYRGDAWKNMQDERAFLTRTVWRTAFDRLQARSTPSDEVGEMLLRDMRPTPEEAAAEDDEQALLHALIDQLSPSCASRCCFQQSTNLPPARSVSRWTYRRALCERASCAPATSSAATLKHSQHRGPGRPRSLGGNT